MTNKERLNAVIEQDINSSGNYNEILKKMEEGAEMKNKNVMWKWSLVPICLVVIIGSVLFFNGANDSKNILKNKPYTDENNVTLNINKLNNENGGLYKIDADVKTVTNNDVNFPLPYKNGLVDIPKDLDKTSKYIFYFREDKESKEYNILGYYEIIYDNGNDRSITVSYSKDNKPARDYYFSDEGTKTTIINGVELRIYKFENIYFTAFRFNDYNFDIETSDITEEELSTFLLSILK